MIQLNLYHPSIYDIIKTIKQNNYLRKFIVQLELEGDIVFFTKKRKGRWFTLREQLEADIKKFPENVVYLRKHYSLSKQEKVLRGNTLLNMRVLH